MSNVLTSQNSQQIFDKIINIDFVQKDGTIDTLKCPPSGMKPEITMSGRFFTDANAKDIELRITNFYPKVPLTDYRVLNLSVGYGTSPLAVISGSVWVAYQESPGPDGVTYFHLFLGDFNKWVNVQFNRSYEKGTPLVSIISAFAVSLGLGISTTILASETLDAPLSFQGFVKDAVAMFCQNYQDIILYMDSKTLTAFHKTENTGRVFQIDLFSSPPRKEAWGWSFTAPWNPAIRPGDVITINPKFYQQTFVTFNPNFNPDVEQSSSSSNNGFPTQPLTVFSIEFDFSTVGSQNNMSVVAFTKSDTNQPMGGS